MTEASRTLLPPELEEGEPFPFANSEHNQQRKQTALGLLEECSNLEKVVWMQVILSSCTVCSAFGRLTHVHAHKDTVPVLTHRMWNS